MVQYSHSEIGGIQPSLIALTWTVSGLEWSDKHIRGREGDTFADTQMYSK
jgi:hypothetical protein